MSCQKENLNPNSNENDYQETVQYFTVPDDAFAAAANRPIPQTCDCSLNVRSNRNNSGTSVDWRVQLDEADYSNPMFPTYSQFIKFGEDTGTHQYSSSDNNDGGPLGSIESVNFTAAKGAMFRLVVAGPGGSGTHENSTYIANVACRTASINNPFSQSHTGHNLAAPKEGRITDECAAEEIAFGM